MVTRILMKVENVMRSAAAILTTNLLSRSAKALQSVAGSTTIGND